MKKKNPDLTTRMHEAAKRVMDLGVLEIIHIASHGKNLNAPQRHIVGNEIADKYAVIAKSLSNFEMQIHDGCI